MLMTRERNAKWDGVRCLPWKIAGRRNLRTKQDRWHLCRSDSKNSVSLFELPYIPMLTHPTKENNTYYQSPRIPTQGIQPSIQPQDQKLLLPKDNFLSVTLDTHKRCQAIQSLNRTLFLLTQATPPEASGNADPNSAVMRLSGTLHRSGITRKPKIENKKPADLTASSMPKGPPDTL